MTVAVASALPVAAVPSIADTPNHDDDAEIRQLWLEYEKRSAAAYRAAEMHRPVLKAYDDRCAQLPKHLSINERRRQEIAIWGELNVSETHAAAEAAYDDLHRMVDAIRALPATTPFGFAVKLSALPPPAFLIGGAVYADHFREAVFTVLTDVDRLMGARFSTMPAVAKSDADDGDEDSVEVVDGMQEPPNALIATDPVYAAIDRHCEAERAWWNRQDEEEAAAEAGKKLRGGRKVMDKLVKEAAAARENLANTVPLTLGGLFAVLKYSDTWEEKAFGRRCDPSMSMLDGNEDYLTWVRSLATCVRNLERIASAV